MSRVDTLSTRDNLFPRGGPAPYVGNHCCKLNGSSMFIVRLFGDKVTEVFSTSELAQRSVQWVHVSGSSCSRQSLIHSASLLLWPPPLSLSLLSLSSSLSPSLFFQTLLQHPQHLSWAGAPHWVTDGDTHALTLSHWLSLHTHTLTHSLVYAHKWSLLRYPIRRSGFSKRIPSASSPRDGKCSVRVPERTERRSRVSLTGECCWKSAAISSLSRTGIS